VTRIGFMAVRGMFFVQFLTRTLPSNNDAGPRRYAMPHAAARLHWLV
jgi:hypothetical protein